MLDEDRVVSLLEPYETENLEPPLETLLGVASPVAGRLIVTFGTVLEPELAPGRVIDALELSRTSSAVQSLSEIEPARPSAVAQAFPNVTVLKSANGSI